jgi:hypothetical protein
MVCVRLFPIHQCPSVSALLEHVLLYLLFITICKASTSETAFLHMIWDDIIMACSVANFNINPLIDINAPNGC